MKGNMFSHSYGEPKGENESQTQLHQKVAVLLNKKTKQNRHSVQRPEYDKIFSRPFKKLNKHAIYFKSFKKKNSILLARVPKIDRVDGSAGFPPANQVLGGGSLTRVEALAGGGLAALGCG